MAGQPDSDALHARVERLEAVVEQQQEIINELREDAGSSGLTRRGALAGLVSATGIGALAGNVVAAPSYSGSSGRIGTDAEPLSNVTAQTARFEDLLIDGQLSDGDNTPRFSVEPGRTKVRTNVGDTALLADAGSIISLFTRPNEPVQIFDEQLGKGVVRYRSTSAGPGRLRLRGAVLDFQSGVSSTTADSMTSDPESDAEDGFVGVDINGSRFQIPVYEP